MFKGENMMGRDFVDRFEKLLQEKNSILCIGLDPALPKQRDKNVIPPKYIEKANINEARLNFCIEILEKTADFCVAAKPNEQYLRGFTAEHHQKLADSIHKQGLLSIYDCKLGDIRDTAESALFHYHMWGYDAITINPFPGNMEELVMIAHRHVPPIGIIVLTLMSNPEAEKFMRNAIIMNKPIYLIVAEDVKRYRADGCVVGATGHVTESDILSIRSTVGEDKVFLIPGVGAQKGDPEKVVRSGGKNILINVGRDIIYSDNPQRKATEYNKMFNEIRKTHKSV
jgi:orotidine 5'-phosphate decarboxylase subfamily 2